VFLCVLCGSFFFDEPEEKKLNHRAHRETQRAEKSVTESSKVADGSLSSSLCVPLCALWFILLFWLIKEE
jgi:hypothetical protein